MVDQLAPSGNEAVDYDGLHLAIYAELLDADDRGTRWQDAAATVLRLDVGQPGAEACWRSHLDRARWIVGAGLKTAITAFGEQCRRT